MKNLKQEINNRLYHSFIGDIKPTDERMIRSVESIYDLIKELLKSLVMEEKNEIQDEDRQLYFVGFNDCNQKLINKITKILK